MLETERLIIRPLTHDQLIKYAKCDNSLEAEFCINNSSRTISDELRDALEQVIIPAVSDKDKNYLYSTLWTAISKEEKKMVGDVCIYGEPNENGEIEIGYGTYEKFQNKGFMTEIVCGFIEWTRSQIIVKSIIATTNKTNVASHKILERNNFMKIGETDTFFKWKLVLIKK